eukprot:3615228-Pleurochrysis_carterae.AAC.1
MGGYVLDYQSIDPDLGMETHALDYHLPKYHWVISLDRYPPEFATRLPSLSYSSRVLARPALLSRLTARGQPRNPAEP